jgi:hypothetical protein
MKLLKETAVGSCVHALSWTVAYLLVKRIFAPSSDAWMAYALLSGWWATLYAGYIFGVRLPVFFVVFLGYVLVGSVSSLFNFSLLPYHDGTSPISYSFGALGFGSSIWVNEMIRFIVSRSAVLSRYVERHTSA